MSAIIKAFQWPKRDESLNPDENDGSEKGLKGMVTVFVKKKVKEELEHIHHRHNKKPSNKENVEIADIELQVTGSEETVLVDSSSASNLENDDCKVWDMSNFGLDEIIFPDIISEVPVETLILSHNEFTSVPLDLLKITSLRQLDLGFNKIDDISSQLIKKLRDHKKIAHIDVQHNLMRAINPEVYSLPHCQFNTQGNPLMGGLIFPSWFFGITFGIHNRFMLSLMDVFFLMQAAFIVSFGYVLHDSQYLPTVEYALISVFFVTLIGLTAYFGIYGIRWTDSIFFIVPELTEVLEMGKEVDGDGKSKFKGTNKQLEDDQKETKKKVIAFAESKLPEKAQKEIKDIQSKIPEIEDSLKEGEKYLEEVAKDHAIEAGKKLIGEARGLKGFLERNANVFAVISMVIELPVLLAFSFTSHIAWPSALNFFQWFVFNFDKYANGYEAGFWAAVIAALAQRIFFETTRNSHLGKYAAAILQTAITSTAVTLFVQLSKSLLCTYGEHGGTLTGYPTELQCWTGIHLFWASVSLVVFMIYYPMAILSVPVWQQRSKGLTILFPSYFLIAIAQVKLLLTLFTSFFGDVHPLYLGANTVCALGLLLLSITLPTRTAKTYNLILLKSKVKIGRMSSYLSALSASIAAIAVANVSSSSVLTIVIILALFQGVIAGIAWILVKIAIRRHKKRIGMPLFFGVVEIANDDEEEDKSKETSKKKKKFGFLPCV